jgi:hypothetical protein
MAYGIIMAEHYRSGVVGLGKNMGEYGAASVDASWSDTLRLIIIGAIVVFTRGHLILPDPVAQHIRHGGVRQGEAMARAIRLDNRHG